MRTALALLLIGGCAAPAATVADASDAAVTADSPVRGDAGVDAGGGTSDAWSVGDAFVPPDAWACTAAPQGGCGSDACRLTGGTPTCGAIASRPGEYMSCGSDNDCDAGQQCISLGGPPTCRVLCTEATICDQSRGARRCRFDFTLFNADTSVELHAPAGIGICGA